MRFSTQRDQFAEHGFGIFERALVGPMLDLLRAQCAAFIAREDARMDAAGVDQIGITHRGKRYFANECLRQQPALAQLLFSDVMADICAATLGPDAYFFFDQYVVKGPESGMPFAWHQDSGYVVGNGGPADHAPYLTCWCPLDDSSAQNGTVRLIPFSTLPRSRDEILPHHRDPVTQDLIGWTDEAGAITLDVPAGSVVAFSSRLLHATSANTTDKMRRVYLAQYTPEVILDPGTRHLRRNAIPLLRRGQKVTQG